jgi:hypothetical protein
MRLSGATRALRLLSVAALIAVSSTDAVQPGALAWFPFDAGAASPSSSGLLAPASASPQAVVSEGAPRVAPGVSGYAYAFDGASRLTAPLDIGESSHPELTLGCWVNVGGVNPGLPSLDRHR